MMENIVITELYSDVSNIKKYNTGEPYIAHDSHPLYVLTASDIKRVNSKYHERILYVAKEESADMKDIITYISNHFRLSYNYLGDVSNVRHLYLDFDSSNIYINHYATRHSDIEIKPKIASISGRLKDIVRKYECSASGERVDAILKGVVAEVLYLCDKEINLDELVITDVYDSSDDSIFLLFKNVQGIDIFIKLMTTYLSDGITKSIEESVLISKMPTVTLDELTRRSRIHHLTT